MLVLLKKLSHQFVDDAKAFFVRPHEDCVVVAPSRRLSLLWGSSRELLRVEGELAFVLYFHLNNGYEFRVGDSIQGDVAGWVGHLFVLGRDGNSARQKGNRFGRPLQIDDDVSLLHLDEAGHPSFGVIALRVSENRRLQTATVASARQLTGL